MVNSFLVTCEHGGNQIPAPLQSLFRGQRALLESHRGYDAGALVMARALAAALDAPLVASTVSRLLIDLNRSIGHPQLFSAPMRDTSLLLRKKIIERHYQPYREKVGQWVLQSVSQGRCLIHISSHSFTPVLDGVIRTADVGLLYDPSRSGESRLCARWATAFRSLAPQFRLRRNYPYEGKADGLAAHLRVRFTPRAYIGIELEINQSIVFSGGRRWTALRSALIESLCKASGNSTGKSQ